jgi:hypothetical protein
LEGFRHATAEAFQAMQRQEHITAAV